MDENRTAAGTEGRPGDEADPGTPGTGEALCPVCSGSGRVDGETCQNCRGSGKVVEGIGGA
jgi:DnaJ-class molecular chaperone